MLYILDHVSCSNGVFCDGEEVCLLILGCIVVFFVQFVVLDDNRSCTVDICNEISDTVLYILNYVVCIDGEFCNGLELCVFCGMDVIWDYDVVLIVKIKCVGCYIDGVS